MTIVQMASSSSENFSRQRHIFGPRSLYFCHMPTNTTSVGLMCGQGRPSMTPPLSDHQELVPRKARRAADALIRWELVHDFRNLPLNGGCCQIPIVGPH